MRVLIIDNNAKQRKKISESLQGEEYEILMAKDGKKGLKLLESEEIKVLIAPYDLPSHPGRDLIALVLEANLESIPFIIFLVDEKSQQNAIVSLGALAGDCIVKPISAESLHARMAVAKRSIVVQEGLERKRQDNKALALYDDLTGVFNRQAVYDQAMAEVSRAQREASYLSVAMIEICNLQQIEEEHGPEIRDQALRYVSSAVRANVRIYDILGRWIGAKFLLLLPNTSLQDSSVVVDRVSQSIATIGISIPDRSRLTLEVKFGVSTFIPSESIPLYMLIDQANSALTEANSEVEKQVVFFDG